MAIMPPLLHGLRVKWLIVVFGILCFCSMEADATRVPWLTSNVQGRPGQIEPYQIQSVSPELTFANPVELVAMPESEWMWMVELRGAIYAFSNKQRDQVKHEVIHLKSVAHPFSSAYGLAFHPDFIVNRQVFLCYVVGGAEPDGTRVSRFEVSDANPPRIVPESEEILITWKGGGHNAGCLRFGPDGYLYIATGDASGPNPPDILNTGQDISDLLASILRIDVEQQDEGLAYAIPDDNPFLNTPDARPEIWAFGFRNPFKMSFDPSRGDLWVGDVGWELWELIFRVEKGSNYGWSIMEGNHPVQPSLEKGPGSFKPPVVEHPHSEAASITGGYVYRGKRLPELQGAYIYGDYETGKIWGLKTEGESVIWHRELVDTSLKIICFGEDQEGELWIVDYAGGLYQLAPNHSEEQVTRFPMTLGDTGLFEDVATHKMAAGVYRYNVEMQPWENGAIAKRWVALPGKSKVVVKDRISVFPTNAVILKTLFWPNKESEEETGKPIESQLLHFDGQAWNAYAYAWDSDGRDGLLVKSEGRIVTDKEKDLMAGALSQNGELEYWKYSSRSDCLRCHNSWSGFALGWNSLQLHGTSHAKTYLKKSWENLDQLELISNQRPKAYKSKQPMGDLEYKAKSYLHANCAHCHRENAGGMVNALMYFEKPTLKSSLIGTTPLRGGFDIVKPEIIAPGDPFRSVLYYRMAKNGPGQMPHLGRREMDVKGMDHIFEWIRSMPMPNDSSENLTDLVLNTVKSTFQRGDTSKTENAVQNLLQKSHGALGLAYAIDHGWLSPAQQEIFKRVYSKIDNTLSKEILRRFFEIKLPLEVTHKIAEILVLQPNLENGRRLFFDDPSMQCSTCHQVNDVGGVFGPDLSEIGKKYTLNQLLEHILEPSKLVDETYRSVTIEMGIGDILTGIVTENNKQELKFRNANGVEIRLLKSEVEDLQYSQLSAMPEGLLESKTVQETRDLLGFLVEGSAGSF